VWFISGSFREVNEKRYGTGYFVESDRIVTKAIIFSRYFFVQKAPFIPIFRPFDQSFRKSCSKKSSRVKPGALLKIID
jgi:hypothetical protein